MPGAGDLRNRVRFDQRGLDANGDRLGDWEEGFEVWAQMIWLRGTEAAQSARLLGEQPVAIVVRDSAQARLITAGFRAVWTAGPGWARETILNITASAPAKEPGFRDILAVAGGAEG